MTQSEQPTSQVAKEEAAEVARTAAQGGGQVGETAGEQARRVAHETTQQARDLAKEGRDQLVDQARQGQRKAAAGLHSLADQLHDMCERSDGSGLAPEVVRQAAERTRGVASWLDDREPGALLDEARAFARRKPGVFLAGAAMAGVLAGRLTRGAVAAAQDSGTDEPGPGTTQATRTATRAATPPPPVPPVPSATPAAVPPPVSPPITPPPPEPPPGAYGPPPVPPPAQPGYPTPQPGPHAGQQGPVTR